MREEDWVVADVELLDSYPKLRWSNQTFEPSPVIEFGLPHPPPCHQGWWQGIGVNLSEAAVFSQGEFLHRDLAVIWSGVNTPESRVFALRGDLDSAPQVKRKQF